MKRIYIIFSLIVPLLSFAQGENDNWYFGNKAAVNFSSSTPVSLTNSNMYAMEGCGTVSDSNGKLLFYMNGETIWNRQHQVMPNGVLLAPNVNDSSQQLAIVKNPGNSNQYYVFTTGENTDTSLQINYSIVDMTLGAIGTNGSPLGDVVQNAKNIKVLDQLGNEFHSEAISIIPHSNDDSFWVLIPNGTELYTYKLNSSGFDNGNPSISNMNFPTNLDLYKYYSIKTSPKITNTNYSHLICISYWTDSFSPNAPDSSYFNQVYSFNASTGYITNDYSLLIKGLRTYLPEFNKNASVLFLGYDNLYAVDLVGSTPSNVQYTEVYHDSSNTVYSGMGIQRNKYGDIYLSKAMKPFLGKVINPDVYGPGMGVDLNAISLTSGISMYGLPPVIPVHDKPEPGEYYPCIDNLTLFSEPNISFYYEIGKKITTQNKYILGARHNITMQAGESINLLPGTFIDNGATYHGFIAPCKRKGDQLLKSNRPSAPVKMFLELDKKEKVEMNKDIKISPNPTSDFLNITTSAKINNVEVFDISGKKINVSVNDTKVDVRHLPTGSYMIMIDTKDGRTAKKFIKK